MIFRNHRQLSLVKFLLAVIVITDLIGCSKSSTASGASNGNNFSDTVVVNNSTGNSSNTTVLLLVGDSTTNNATRLQAAIDSCSNVNVSKGTVGILEIPAGKYMTGPFSMLSNVNLQLDAGAVLLADTAEGDYTVNGKLVNFISSGASSLQNVSITGSGTINGRGTNWWAAYPGSASLRPRLIYITNCTNLTISGITLENSPSFHFVPYGCTNVTASNVTINTPGTTPNTDGIDPSQSSNVTITNCSISDGDDNIAIKAQNGISQNITIKNCIFGSGHGLSIGSETNDNVTGVTVDSCTFNGTTNGIRIKSYTSAGGAMTNLTYSYITMTNVQNPIVIDLDYSNDGTGTAAVPSVSGFTINNLTATGASNAGQLNGLSNSILQNITLTGINISATSPMVISNANNITISGIINGVTVAPGTSNITATNVTGRTGF